MDFLDKWKQGGIAAAFAGDKNPTPPPVQSVSQAPLPVTPITLIPTAIPMTSVIDLPDTTRQAFVDEIAGQVPDLKKLLDNAALFIDDVPDFAKRLNIAAKQLRGSGQFDAQKALSGLKQSVANMSQALQGEVVQEETQNITNPKEQMNQLEMQRQKLLQQAEGLVDQIATINLRVTTAQESFAKSKAKCDAGIAYMQNWQSQIEQLLKNLK